MAFPECGNEKSVVRSAALTGRDFRDVSALGAQGSSRVPLMGELFHNL